MMAGHVGIVAALEPLTLELCCVYARKTLDRTERVNIIIITASLCFKVVVASICLDDLRVKKY
jgi:hypothetical protein